MKPSIIKRKATISGSKDYYAIDIGGFIFQMSESDYRQFMMSVGFDSDSELSRHQDAPKVRSKLNDLISGKLETNPVDKKSRRTSWAEFSKLLEAASTETKVDALLSASSSSETWLANAKNGEKCSQMWKCENGFL